MIKLATVFSGIGAVEHALNRMNIGSDIVFACDNGDIDIFSKKIDVDMDQINDELSVLKSLIEDMKFSEDDSYELQLLNMLHLAENEYDELKDILNNIIVKDKIAIIISILENIINSSELNKTRLNLFNTFIYILNSDDYSLTEKKLILLRAILKLTNDFKRDNSLDDLGKDDMKFISQYDIDWSQISKSLKDMHVFLEDNNGRRVINRVRNLSQRVSQLYGKIESLKHLNEINKIEDYSKKKEYVDNLYHGNEKRNKVKTSYMANYECSDNNFHWDVTFLDGTQYRNQVDLFVGGSPCQSFSSLGKKRGLSDTRGTLFYEYARLVDEIQPKVFIYENVRAVLSNDCGRTWDKMKEVFKELGYNIFFTHEDKPSVLNAVDYGIPQSRNRIFVVGFRSDLDLVKNFEFPKSIPLEHYMKDFLLDNAPYGTFLPDKTLKFIQTDKKEKIDEKYFLSERIKKTILSSGPNGLYGEPEIDRKIALPLLSTMHKMHRAGTDNYVTTDGKIRRLTPRECLRLMGFSDNWKIVVSDTSVYQQAGNSIVVDVLINILSQIFESYPVLITDNED
ncbi:DNA cytosine methyltransferase [Methanobrevibacter millerae]|uniref:DNA (cytosine-5-)-methyltransferase n=1 Tax=Methanobrevibacter millerae TaxID=230361 RepID=A0A0U3CGQ3_9EURY|nr:DNA cytosine methyltransferase [Methanobrevibacter millerae]ALT68987.1 DNA-cytosine methyltransferase [Methanobrevibacter millerae]